MSEAKDEEPGKPVRFQPGHVRFGGRRKRTAAQARAMAEELGADPLEYMLKLLTVDSIEEIEIDASGNERRVKVPVRHDLKIDICKALAPYLYPRLTATQVTGKDDGPVAVVGADITAAILADPAAVDLAQRLAVQMSQPKALETRAEGVSSDTSLVASVVDTTDRKDHRGHWMPR